MRLFPQGTLLTVQLPSAVSPEKSSESQTDKRRTTDKSGDDKTEEQRASLAREPLDAELFSLEARLLKLALNPLLLEAASVFVFSLSEGDFGIKPETPSNKNEPTIGEFLLVAEEDPAAEQSLREASSQEPPCTSLWLTAALNKNSEILLPEHLAAALECIRQKRQRRESEASQTEETSGPRVSKSWTRRFRDSPRKDLELVVIVKVRRRRASTASPVGPLFLRVLSVSEGGVCHSTPFCFREIRQTPFWRP